MKKIFCLLLAFGCLLGCSPQKQNKETGGEVSREEQQDIENQKHKNELKKYKSYESGTYKIGEDIKEGEYCLIVKDLVDYDTSFQIRNQEYADGEDSILYDMDFLQYYLYLKKGEYIEFDKALLFNVDDMPYLDQKMTYCMLKVGKDIDPGNYKVIPIKEEERVIRNYVYFAVLEPIAGEERNEVITNGYNFMTEKKIKLKSGQYIKLDNCKLEKVN